MNKVILLQKKKLLKPMEAEKLSELKFQLMEHKKKKLLTRFQEKKKLLEKEKMSLGKLS